MKYVQWTSDFRINEKTAVTLGKFDGLHRGHQKLINYIIGQKKHGLKAVVITFHKSPASILGTQEYEVLLTNEERYSMLKELGIDYLIEFQFNEHFSRMEPETFIREVLVNSLGVAYMAVGTDFCFGYQRMGTIKTMEYFASKYNYRVEIADKVNYRNYGIGSRYIKEALKEGRLDDANNMLGYHYIIQGIVVSGKKLGRTIGVPTTNLIPAKEKVLPPNGVYVTKSRVDGSYFGGITNIGYKPTIGGESHIGIETFMFHFHDNIYGKWIEVSLYAFERAEKKFQSLADLEEQLKKDIAFGKEYFND